MERALARGAAILFDKPLSDKLTTGPLLFDNQRDFGAKWLNILPVLSSEAWRKLCIAFATTIGKIAVRFYVHAKEMFLRDGLVRKKQ